MLQTFAIDTLGCKVNQYESQQIRALLTKLGLKPIKTNQKPDLTVINTCCVTKTASAKSRQYINKAEKLNFGPTVVVVGCLTSAPLVAAELGKTGHKELRLLGDNVHIIKNRPAIAAELSRIITGDFAPKELQPQQKPTPPKQPLQLRRLEVLKTTRNKAIRPQNHPKIKPKNRSKLPKLPDLTAFAGHTRAFLKAQDGCDSYCTYCIIPKVRPKISSRPLPDILAEAARLIQSGHKEIVLTGICLGAYGRNTTRRRKWPDSENDHFAELLDKLASTPGLRRLRVSSLSPQDITDQLLDVFAEHSNIMPHLHLSLQSGSDRILRRMARQYTTADYLQKVQMIKSRLDIPAITTDIIVGFPGETDSDFEDTLALAKEVGFARIHVFSFSARKDTPADKMTPKVKPQVIKERSQVLQKIANQLAYDYRNKFIGQAERVLIESVENGTATGHAERYFEVKIPNLPSALKKNDIAEVNLTENTPDLIIAQFPHRPETTA